jgi:hypothetical protein
MIGWHHIDLLSLCIRFPCIHLMRYCAFFSISLSGSRNSAWSSWTKLGDVEIAKFCAKFSSDITSSRRQARPIWQITVDRFVRSQRECLRSHLARSAQRSFRSIARFQPRLHSSDKTLSRPRIWLCRNLSRRSTQEGIKKRFCFEQNHAQNLCHPMIARISYSLINKMQKKNHKRCFKTMNNQSNSQIVQNIQPKCPGMPIGAKQRMVVTRPVNGFLTGW